MAYAPFPSNDGSELFDPARAPGFRLRDAEKIAADRLESGNDGSLEAALANAGIRDNPANEIEHLADRIEAAQGAYVPTIMDSSSLPFPPEPAYYGSAGEALEQLTLLGLREWSDARAAVAAELAEMQSQPLFLQSESQQVGGGTYWQPGARDADPYHPPAESQAKPDAPAEPEPAASKPAASTAPEAPAEPTIAPIATALDAAAKLAADADAAAAALENLARLLQNHQRPVPLASATAAARALQPVAQRPPQPAPRPAAAAPNRRPMPARAAAAAPGKAARPITPPALRPAPPAPRETRQLDLRGFMAGFALSCAIGAVLYIYLQVG